MSTSAPDFWAQMSDGFQQNLSKSWGQAMQHFQTIDLGGLKPSADAALPQLKFSPEKLQSLQGQYFKDASELWNQSLHNSLQVKDRRFSGDAWSSNPMAAFNAATYLLNARTLMGLADPRLAGTKVGEEFATSSVSSPGLENYLVTLSPAQIKGIFEGVVDDLNWMDASKRGFLKMSFSAAEAKGEWFFVNTITNRTYTSTLGKTATMAA